MIGIVISQSCDLVHHCFDNEPCVEIVLGEFVNEFNGNFRFGKNPRKLHLTIQFYGAKEPQWVELVPFNKVTMPRLSLADSLPNNEAYVSERDVTVLASWFAARYDRAAFPDAFNDRVKASLRDREKIAKRISADVLALFIQITPSEELPPERQYSINLVAVIPSQSKEKLDSVTHDVQEFANLLRSANIEVDKKDVKIRLEDNAPFTLVTQYKRYDFDHISLREDPAHPMINRS